MGIDKVFCKLPPHVVALSKQYRGPVLKHPLSNLKERTNIGNPDSKGMFWPDQLSSTDAGTTPSYENQSLGPLKTQSLRK